MRGELGETAIPRDLRLDVRLELAPGDRRSDDRSGRRFVERLEAAVLQARDEIQLQELGYRPGHLHCYWCENSICEHSLPPTPRAVFAGYDPTGTPRWRDFGSWIVERRDPRMERLYLVIPQPLALPIPTEELMADLLPEFERPAEQRDGERTPTFPRYTIVAQLVAGTFLLPMPLDELDCSIALTAQIVEQRGPGGDPAYSLNLLCEPPAPHE
ncbi:MAG: hypothetical protein KDC38_13170, partial [Planctomycetes bacterium]|nr:hypothetical protein [Planctomycetota bacterium]